MYNRVLAHSHFVILKDAVFKVNERGRQNVIRTKSKNVHAVVIGELLEIVVVKDRLNFFKTYRSVKIRKPEDSKCFEYQQVRKKGKHPDCHDIYYDPYILSQFVIKETVVGIDSAWRVWFTPEGKVSAIIQPLD